MAKASVKLPKVGEKYKHQKGGVYKVIALGLHTETEESMVVYTDKFDLVWCRPMDHWMSLKNGKPRFVLQTKKEK